MLESGDFIAVVSKLKTLCGTEAHAVNVLTCLTIQWKSFDSSQFYDRYALSCVEITQGIPASQSVIQEWINTNPIRVLILGECCRNVEEINRNSRWNRYWTHYYALNESILNEILSIHSEHQLNTLLSSMIHQFTTQLSQNTAFIHPLTLASLIDLVQIQKQFIPFHEIQSILSLCLSTTHTPLLALLPPSSSPGFQSLSTTNLKHIAHFYSQQLESMHSQLKFPSPIIDIVSHLIQDPMSYTIPVFLILQHVSTFGKRSTTLVHIAFLIKIMIRLVILIYSTDIASSVILEWIQESYSNTRHSMELLRVSIFQLTIDDSIVRTHQRQHVSESLMNAIVQKLSVIIKNASTFTIRRFQTLTAVTCMLTYSVKRHQLLSIVSCGDGLSRVVELLYFCVCKNRECSEKNKLWNEMMCLLQILVENVTENNVKSIKNLEKTWTFLLCIVLEFNDTELNRNDVERMQELVIQSLLVPIANKIVVLAGSWSDCQNQTLDIVRAMLSAVMRVVVETESEKMRKCLALVMNGFQLCRNDKVRSILVDSVGVMELLSEFESSLSETMVENGMESVEIAAQVGSIERHLIDECIQMSSTLLYSSDTELCMSGNEVLKRANEFLVGLSGNIDGRMNILTYFGEQSMYFHEIMNCIQVSILVSLRHGRIHTLHTGEFQHLLENAVESMRSLIQNGIGIPLLIKFKPILEHIHKTTVHSISNHSTDSKNLIKLSKLASITLHSLHTSTLDLNA